MNAEKVKEALREARKFINRADVYLAAVKKESDWPSPRESGALKRQSLELTRALADMRRPN